MIKEIFKYLSLIVISPLLLASGNPGEFAMDCVRATTVSDKVTFRNLCDKQIFIVWCGEVNGSDKRCGRGPRDQYYTDKANLHPFGRQVVTINGQYQYAACVGKINKITEGITAYSDEKGDFSCDPTGSYLSERVNISTR